MRPWPQMTLAGGPVEVTARTLRDQSRPVAILERSLADLRWPAKLGKGVGAAMEAF